MDDLLLEKYLPTTNKYSLLTRSAVQATRNAHKRKTEDSHYLAAKKHLKAAEAHKAEHLKLQKVDNSDIYAYNRAKNLALAHLASFKYHKNFINNKKTK
jgi:hypothetical protein